MKQKFTQWILGSFDNSTRGSSSKKLSAFVFVLLSIYLHLFFCSLDYAVEFLIIDCSTILGLLGVSSWEKLKREKSNGDNQSTEVN